MLSKCDLLTPRMLVEAAAQAVGDKMVANGKKSGDLTEKIMQNFLRSRWKERLCSNGHTIPHFIALCHTFRTDLESLHLRSGLYTQSRGQ